MADNLTEHLREVPETPVGRQVRWYLSMIATDGAAAALDDRERCAPVLAAMWKGVESVERMREIWRVNAARMGALAGISFEAAEDLSARVVMLTAKDRKWRLSMTVEAEPPHRLTQWTVERKHDFQLEVREAVPADAQVLADIERRCPVELGETRFWFDRGDDYFAFARLMEDRTIGIASVDGVPAAVSCGARHVVRIAGTLRPIMTVSHLRVLPEHQRKGLWGAANSALNKYRDTTEGSNAYISERNAGMQHGFIDTPNKWAIPVLRMQLPCAALAGPSTGRAATPSDVETIVDRLNRFHGEEEMFVPWTEARFAARLERAPELYSWDRLWLDGEALVGVWPAGDSLRVVTETAGVRTESTRGMVLDYAFAPGAEDAFERLLRAWCGWLAGRGVDALSIFTSPASPGAGLLRALAGEVEAFDMWTPGIEAPADVVRHGVYVDPIYF